jgi:hypothetical protein
MYLREEAKPPLNVRPVLEEMLELITEFGSSTDAAQCALVSANIVEIILLITAIFAKSS